MVGASIGGCLSIFPGELNKEGTMLMTGKHKANLNDFVHPCLSLIWGADLGSTQSTPRTELEISALFHLIFITTLCITHSILQLTNLRFQEVK